MNDHGATCNHPAWCERDGGDPEAAFATDTTLDAARSVVPDRLREAIERLSEDVDALVTAYPFDDRVVALVANMDAVDRALATPDTAAHKPGRWCGECGDQCCFEPTPDTAVPLDAKARYEAWARERLTDHIAAMLHYRGRTLHPRQHPKASGGPCDECIESARQAVEFVTAEDEP